MVTRKKALGRGLDALFGEIEQPRPVRKAEQEDLPDETLSTKETSIASEDNEENRIVYIEIDDIRPNSMQPRQKFESSAIDDLAKSIDEHGVIQPVILRKSKNGFEMVAGERRWRAARKAGLRKIPAIIRNLDDTENALVALIENMQREDLNPIEEAEAFENIIKKYKITQEVLAGTVGKSRPYISNTLRLARMPLEIIELIRAGELSRGHANAIGSLSNKDKQLEMARLIVKNGLSVREAENLSANMTENDKSKTDDKTKKKTGIKNPEIKAVEDELTTSLGSKVTINTNGKKGKIEIFYHNHDELNELIDILRSLK